MAAVQIRKGKRDAKTAYQQTQAAIDELTGQSWADKTTAEKSEALRSGLVLGLRMLLFLGRLLIKD